MKFYSTRDAEHKTIEKDNDDENKNKALHMRLCIHGKSFYYLAILHVTVKAYSFLFVFHCCKCNYEYKC
jgi:hypothetical protein